MELKPYHAKRFTAGSSAKPQGERQNDQRIEEKVFGLFEPDILLPAQFLANHRRNTFLQPEKTLMLAILDDAVKCFKDHLTARSSRGKKLFAEAEEWIVNETDGGVFSFENICGVLGMDASHLRQGLMRWKDRQIFNGSERLAQGERNSRLRVATSV